MVGFSTLSKAIHEKTFRFDGRSRVHEAVAFLVVDIMDERYRIVLADPPWSYRNKKTGGSMTSGSETQYPTMSVEEICAIDVKSIAHKNAVLFLWSTVPLRADLYALKVIEAWGFKFKGALFWVKTGKLGMGHWFRNQVEILYFAVRGNIKPFGLPVRNVYSSAPERHSAKPEFFRKLIERTGLTPRVELFARKKVEGWDAWGMDVLSDIQL